MRMTVNCAIFQMSCLLACRVDTVDSLQIFMAFGINNELTSKKRHEKVSYMSSSDWIKDIAFSERGVIEHLNGLG